MRVSNVGGQGMQTGPPKAQGIDSLTVLAGNRTVHDIVTKDEEPWNS